MLPKAEAKLVKVRWTDAASATGWSSKSESPLAECENVGWLTSKTKESITLSAGRNSEGHWGDQIAIPRASVRSIKRLRT